MKAQPRIDAEGVPMCDERCPAFDGKRCEILGHRPDEVCRPGLAALIEQREELLALAEQFERDGWLDDEGSAIVARARRTR